MKRLAFLTYVGAAGFASGDFVYTENGANDFWSNRFNWRFGVIDPAGDYPNGSSPGTDIEVEIPEGLAVLSEPIRIKDLDLATNPNNRSATVDLDGQTLTVEGDLVSSGNSVLKGGNLSADQILLNDGGMRLDGVDVTVANTEMAVGLSLENACNYWISDSFLITDDSDISVRGAGNSVLHNNGGSFGRIGTAGISNIACDYIQTGGVVYSGSGTLQIDGRATVNAGNIVSEDRLIFKGETTLGSPGFVANLEGKVVRLEGPTTITGTINSGEALFSPVGGSVRLTNTFSGGNFDLTPSVPFVMIAGGQLAPAPASNEGTFIWSGGSLTNFENTAVAPDGLILRSVPDTTGAAPRELDGVLGNTGRILHDDGTLFLESGAVLENEVGAQYEIVGGSIREASGASNAVFRNDGQILKSAPAAGGPSPAQISAPLVSSGVIEVEGADLSISGEAELGGEVIVDRSTSPSAILRLGAGSGAEQTLEDLNFQGKSGGVLEFRDGDFNLKGRFESEGDSGEGHFSRNASRLVVKAGELAVVDFNENVPLRFGANQNSAGIRPTGELRNEGMIISEDLNVIGSGLFTNEGMIRVEKLLYLSSTSGTETGFVSNLGMVDLTQDTSNSIRMRAGGVFTNETGGVVLLDEVGILGENGATTPEFVNRGVLRAPNGGVVRAFFEQSGSPDALVEIEQGTLFFDRDARFESGVLRSRNRILFSEDVILGDVGVELVNGGELLFQGTTTGSTADVYTLKNDLQTSGDGLVRLSGGKLVPESGNVGVVFNASGTTRFQQDGGEVGQAGETLGNDGIFEQTQGRILGNFVNRGEFLSRGEIEGNFTNLGRFDLVTGKIGGQFTNGDLANPALGVMTVSAGSRLVDDAVLTSFNDILITGSVGLQNRARFDLQRGTITVTTSNGIVGVGGTSDHELLVGSAGEINWTADSTVTVDRLTLNGGKLNAKAGSSLNLFPDQVTLNGGTLEVEDGGRLVLRGAPIGSGPSRVVADGDLIFDLINTPNPAAVTIPPGGEVTGSGSIEGLLTVNGALNPEGSLDLTGSLTQSDTSTTTIDVSINDADQVLVDGDVILDGILNLNVSHLGPITPGRNLTLISGTSVTGTFDQVAGLQSPALSVGQSLEIVYLPTRVELALTATNTNFQTWAADVFDAAQQADPTVSGPNADPDSDGVANIFEFIGGTSPTSGGDVFRFSFEVIPATTPGEVNTRYTIPVSPGRIGFEIEVLSLGDLSDPNDDQVVPHTGIFDLVNSILVLDSDQSVAADSEFQSLRATLR